MNIAQKIGYQLSDKIYYVLGFIFSKDLKKVYLLRKKRPEWQNGLLNGIGGKIEKDELPIEAIIRESREEINYVGEWIPIGTIVENNNIVYCYYSVLDNVEFKDLKSNLDETLEEIEVKSIFEFDEIYIVNGCPEIIKASISTEMIRQSYYCNIEISITP